MPLDAITTTAVVVAVVLYVVVAKSLVTLRHRKRIEVVQLEQRQEGTLRPELKPLPDRFIIKPVSHEPGEEKNTGGVLIPEAVHEELEDLGILVDGDTLTLQSPKAPDPLAALDDILDKLPVGQTAYHVPTPMVRGKVYEVSLALSATCSVEELELFLANNSPAGPATFGGAKIKIGPEMQATLTGQEFHITRATPETQLVSRKDSTVWRWQVRPLRAGSLRLHFSLSVLLNSGAQPVPKVIRTFDRDIDVHVTGLQRLGDIFKAKPEWTYTAIVIPVAFWLLKNWFTSYTHNHPAVLVWFHHHFF
jgi:hypothetical protein